MTIFITVEHPSKLAKYFELQKWYRVIDIDELKQNIGRKLSKETYQFLLNQEIINKIAKYRAYAVFNRGVIYKNECVDEEVINNIRELEYVDKIVIIDNFDNPKMKKLWKLADSVISIPRNSL